MSRRKLFTLATGASAVVCAVVCILWVRSYKSPERFSGLRGGDRYTLVSVGGRLTLFGPPQGPALANNPRDAANLVGRLRNADVRWTARGDIAVIDGYLFDNHPTRPGPVELWRGSVGQKLDGGGFGPGNARLLLAALERPDAFVAAHVLLTRRIEPPNNTGYGGQRLWMWDRDPGAIQPPPKRDPVVWGRFYGLRSMIRLKDGGKNTTPHVGVAWVDPAQIPAIRDQWHRRLDVVVWSVRYPWAAVATSILPLLWTSVTVRYRYERTSRQRLGLCLACGYDLRHSPTECPECGTAPAKGAAA